VDLLQFTIEQIMIIFGIAVIVSLELTTMIAVVIVILRIVTIYDVIKRLFR
jgi:hypothetical protein